MRIASLARLVAPPLPPHTRGEAKKTRCEGPSRAGPLGDDGSSPLLLLTLIKPYPGQSPPWSSLISNPSPTKANPPSNPLDYSGCIRLSLRRDGRGRMRRCAKATFTALRRASARASLHPPCPPARGGRLRRHGVRIPPEPDQWEMMDPVRYDY